MRTTVFSTPLITPLLRVIAIVILKLTGWKAVGEEIGNPRFVLIAAPHTSNWDFPLMLLVVLKLRLELYWMGKNSLFPFGFGWLMRWLGGISIDRAKSHNVVNETVRQYREHESLVILIPPEGTRSKVTTWKSGFYHIANNANVPIMMGYIDAATKEAGLADLFHPTGNLKQDIREIRAFYSKKIGLRAENS
ncbi:MAG TPA: glycerol acyltransferase [Gammaproteobacteria bacterium]|jgi:1-acyl-sn-glycerol-3-phosphate acyltransferase|nr:glycerol acyltransferase [Gammaproteobacteria bacterium]HIL64303.1 glycerol acyltransferase [Porticoccaceae bacterium]|tara:strand:- start:23830 stop:24405 length:576 start_codon:yes stop_codon:yes gene_type:complete